MIPIVFCASFAPWFKLNAAADRSCSLRNQRSTRDGGIQRKIHMIDVMIAKPRISPISGDRKMKRIVFFHPLVLMMAKPALGIAAAAYPPMRACEELVGRP